MNGARHNLHEETNSHPRLRNRESVRNEPERAPNAGVPNSAPHPDHSLIDIVDEQAIRQHLAQNYAQLHNQIVHDMQQQPRSLPYPQRASAPEESDDFTQYSNFFNYQENSFTPSDQASAQQQYRSRPGQDERLEQSNQSFSLNLPPQTSRDQQLSQELQEEAVSDSQRNEPGSFSHSTSIVHFQPDQTDGNPSPGDFSERVAEQNSAHARFGGEPMVALNPVEGSPSVFYPKPSEFGPGENLFIVDSSGSDHYPSAQKEGQIPRQFEVPQSNLTKYQARKLQRKQPADPSLPSGKFDDLRKLSDFVRQKQLEQSIPQPQSSYLLTLQNEKKELKKSLMSKCLENTLLKNKIDALTSQLEEQRKINFQQAEEHHSQRCIEIAIIKENISQIRMQLNSLDQRRAANPNPECTVFAAQVLIQDIHSKLDSVIKNQKLIKKLEAKKIELALSGQAVDQSLESSSVTSSSSPITTVCNDDEEDSVVTSVQNQSPPDQHQLMSGTQSSKHASPKLSMKDEIRNLSNRLSMNRQIEKIGEKEMQLIGYELKKKRLSKKVEELSVKSGLLAKNALGVQIQKIIQEDEHGENQEQSSSSVPSSQTSDPTHSLMKDESSESSEHPSLAATPEDIPLSGSSYISSIESKEHQQRSRIVPVQKPSSRRPVEQNRIRTQKS